MAVRDAQNLVAIAQEELGYCEKASNSQLDDKVANAGSANYTKYARDLDGVSWYNYPKNGFEWCCVFVDWCFWKLCNENVSQAKAMKYVTDGTGAAVSNTIGFYRSANKFYSTPQVGDQFFTALRGHTGLVKTVNGNTITTIEGNYNNRVMSTTRNISDLYGFGRPDYVSNYGWNCKPIGGYVSTSGECLSNVQSAYSYLSSRGFTLNAICGILGNVQYESGMNPWRWQSDDVLSINDVETIRDSAYHGYGLFQYTPAGKYIYDSTAQVVSGFQPNFSDRTGGRFDGEAQLGFMALNSTGQFFPSSHSSMTFSQYKVSTNSPESLAEVWLYNFERPADPSASLTQRKNYARYFYDYLSGYVPPIPPRPGFDIETKPKHNWKFYVYLKR